MWDSVLLSRVPITLRMQANDFVALEGPVERRNGRLVLRVPLRGGGERLKLVTATTSYEEDGLLVVVLPDWLSSRLQLHEGSAVHVDDRWGRLNIARLQ